MKPTKDWDDFFERALSGLEAAQRRRFRQVSKHAAGQLVERNGQLLVNFGGNDYLGLRSDPSLIEAAINALKADGVGSGASPAVTGFQVAQKSLQERLAEFMHQPDALIFSSGFAGNLATLSCLVGAGDAIFSDALNHASLIDGCRLSKASRMLYSHCDMDDLSRQLKLRRHEFRRAVLVTESIFSMDGDAAPLLALAELCDRYDCGLVVDEAHATGIYGPTGAGMVEELSLGHRVLAKLGTLSKAIGCVGGFVCGTQPLVEYVLNHGRSYMFSTALPSCLLTAAERAIDLIVDKSQERTLLRHMACEVRQRLRSAGWQVLGVDSPIVPVVIGGEVAALALSSRLSHMGLYVPAIRPPTVPEGACRLRVSLSSQHTSEQLDRLCCGMIDSQIKSNG